MIFLGSLNETDVGKYSIGFIHYMPFDEENGLGKTEEELLNEGLLIEELPRLEGIPNKAPILYCNPSIREVWYEYVDIPETEEQKREREDLEIRLALADMAETYENKITELQLALAEIVEGGIING